MWSRLDTICLSIVTLAAGALRFIAIGRPSALMFDEAYYAPDACRYVEQAADLCGSGEFTYMHPPLAKWLMAIGIQFLGFGRVGLRVPAAIVGVLTVVALYLLARKIFRSTVAATVASGLLAIDFLHLVHSRLAMLDAYVTFFGVLAALFAALDRDDERSGWLRGWRIAAGAAAGAAVASKWAGVLALVAVAIWIVSWDRRRRPLRQSLLSLGLTFVVVALGVYALSYVGRIQAPLFAAPWVQDGWLYQFVQRQIDMLEYHLELPARLAGHTHAYASPSWSWLLIKRPIVYFIFAPNGRYFEILGIGNPLAWWSGLVAFAWLAFRWLRGVRPKMHGYALWLFAATYGAWLVLPRGGPESFLYYVLPAIPFLYLASGGIAALLCSRRGGRMAVWIVALGSVVMLAFFYPVLTARPLSIPDWRERMWFRDCVPLQENGDGELVPSETRAGGWCWI